MKAFSYVLKKKTKRCVYNIACHKPSSCLCTYTLAIAFTYFLPFATVIQEAHEIHAFLFIQIKRIDCWQKNETYFSEMDVEDAYLHPEVGTSL